ncbi:hypothetical protein N499_0339, partial [Wolbachia pipientis wVitA]
PRHPATC